MKRAAIGLGLVLALSAASVVAQGNTFKDSACPPPADDADVVICPEQTLTTATGDYAMPTIYVRDARYGWLRMTPCDGAIVACESVYVDGSIAMPDELVEVVLDDDDRDG